MVERCVCCGEIIPEGRQVCPSCEEKENRLIDPSVLIRDLTSMKSVYDAIELDGIIKALKEAPAVAAVEVVRCKDCRYYKESEIFKGVKFCYRLRGRGGKPVGYNFCADDFCSRGERKNDEN